MNYKLYKLSFSTPVHFGNGRLGSCENRFLADRLFSTICIEAKKMFGTEGIESVYQSAVSGKLLISDSMPYCHDTLYIPKPIMTIERDTDRYDNNSVIKKSFKKLSYIPSDSIDKYIKGDFDATAENEKLSGLGVFSEKTSASIHEDDDALPYNVGTYNFNPDCGLYFIIGYENDDIFFKFDDIMYSLGYTGIGGKVSSGFGKFEAVITDVPEELLKMLTNQNADRYITLSVCMAKEDELENAVSEAEFSMIRRSGFVNSVSYSETFRKKKDMYCFAGGSSFKNKFEGDVYDISDGGSHAVYRYAKPLFMGVNL